MQKDSVNVCVVYTIRIKRDTDVETERGGESERVREIYCVHAYIIARFTSHMCVHALLWHKKVQHDTRGRHVGFPGAFGGGLVPKIW